LYFRNSNRDVLSGNTALFSSLDKSKNLDDMLDFNRVWENGRIWPKPNMKFIKKTLAEKLENFGRKVRKQYRHVLSESQI